MKEIKKKGCDTKSCMLCNSCMKEWHPAINANKKTLIFKKGDVLFSEGEVLKSIFFVYRGLVKVHKQWGDNKELIVRFAKSGQIVGHRGLGGDTILPVSATALEDTAICAFDLDFFYATLKTNHTFLLDLMLFFANELKESERGMRNLAHMPVKIRVAQAVLNLKENFGVDDSNVLDIHLSRQDLASYVGTTYETLFRILNELEEEGLIKISGKNIALPDEEKLRHVVVFSAK